MRTWISAFLLCSLTGVPIAHAQYMNRPEQTYRGLNDNIGQQQRMQQQQQQNQFENNQLRQNLQRDQLFVPPPSGTRDLTR